MKTLKYIVGILYVLVIVVMGVATFVEQRNGTAYASRYIYGSWCFVVLWALLTASGLYLFLRRRVRVPSAVGLHTSLVLILLGALLTHFTSLQGFVHLRQGETTETYFVQTDQLDGSMEQRHLPFRLRLNTFRTVYHAGTQAPADFESRLTLEENHVKRDVLVSMNNIFSYRGYRFYQTSFDDDGRGSILSLNRDRWGIPVTYTGYALLFLSLLGMLCDPRGTYRRLWRNPLLKRGALLVVTYFAVGQTLQAAPVLPRETADRFGRLHILYNDRICPVQTFALDFTKKLYGKSSYKGMTAEQVVTGFLFYGDDWSFEPIIRVKDGALKRHLHLPDYASLSSFFSVEVEGGYTLAPFVQAYYHGKRGKAYQQAADLDDKLQLIMELRRGLLLKMFPCSVSGETRWFSPTDSFPSDMPFPQQLYTRKAFVLVYSEILEGKTDSVNLTLDRMLRYQHKYGGASLPSATQVRCERMYNAVPWATILFMVNLTLGFITLGLEIVRLTRRDTAAGRRWQRVTGVTAVAVMSLSFLALTLCEALRWVVSGKVPMSNGYETMLFVAWLVMLASLLACRRFRIVLTFGFLMSGFFLLVSHIGQMDPGIGRVMPVLNSPLLSVHVSIIMTGFALFSLTFICGVTALVLKLVGHANSRLADQLASLQLLSQLFLYPAMTFLGIGIFVGAIWANVSWGTYWSWDPKETWALITFMVYAAALHPGLLPALRRPLPYHVFMTLAFLTLLMTYFGVNYVLGGMHSYA